VLPAPWLQKYPGQSSKSQRCPPAPEHRAAEVHGPGNSRSRPRYRLTRAKDPRRRPSLPKRRPTVDPVRIILGKEYVVPPALVRSLPPSSRFDETPVIYVAGRTHRDGCPWSLVPESLAPRWSNWARPTGRHQNGNCANSMQNPWYNLVWSCLSSRHFNNTTFRFAPPLLDSHGKPDASGRVRPPRRFA
jgi:hypothetical protein